ncbi:U4/U6-U5 snRNP complex subunit prp31 [Orobanche hederae]
MGSIAPNLSGVVGAGVAARLMAAAGGLSALVNMPACNVQLLGAKRTALAGFSSRLGLGVVGGYLQQTDIFCTIPSSLRMRACRLLAAKTTLASRVDFMEADPTGNTGKRMRQEIVNKIDKWQEPPPARYPKPLRLPDSKLQL